MRPRPGSLNDRILQIIKRYGPITARDVARDLETPLRAVQDGVAKLKAGRCIHVSGYRRDEDGGALHPRPLYVAGPGEDAPRPPRLTQAEYDKRYRARRNTCVTSVFDFAAPKRSRRVPIDWRPKGAA
jgi:hypothetical protein